MPAAPSATSLAGARASALGWPAPLRIRTLRTRIAVLVLSLLLGVQVAGFLAIRASIDRQAHEAIGARLGVGERVYARLIEQNAGKLAQAARVLAADFGFRAAVASDDRDTVASALENHAGRIGATLASFHNADGALKSSSTDAAALVKWQGETGRFDKLIEGAGRDGWSGGQALVEGHLYQLVVVPVKAPVTIGWVVMGFAVDRELAADMRALLQLDISFIDAAGSGQVLATSLSAEAAQRLAHAGLPTPGAMGDVNLDGEDFGVLALAQPVLGSGAVVAVLQASLSEAVAPYARLQFVLIALTLAGLMFSVVGSLATARRVTQPMNELAESARRLGAGQYETPVPSGGDREIAQLAGAFNQMREGIAEREGRIRRLAYWDQLTGLPNRDQFLMRLEAAIDAAATRGERLAVLMLDLDRFKHVNDVLGHGFGDALLKEVARRLESALVRRGDCVARLGGDEFAVLLPEQDATSAQALAMRLRAALEEPFSVEDHTIDMGAAAGLAAYPEHGETATLLLSRVEIAMYAAKRRRAGVLAYDPAFDEKSQDNLSMLTELRRAVEGDELVLYFQPKLALADGAVTGVETLVRWTHPQRGFVPPGDFIPFAEHTGFITEITRWVMAKSVEQAARWQGEGIALKIAVNLSTRDLMDLDLPQRFAAMLERHGVAASSFCLEITESAIMDDPQRALGTLDRLHDMGFSLSIDDFGTGYSSLAYLKRLPVDEIKIDRSFVGGLEKDRDDAVIVRSTIDLGHNMGLQVVAEGVENEAIWHLLRQAGCDIGQGYFMSKPIPASQFAAWHAAWQPPRAPAAAIGAPTAPPPRLRAVR